jgi:hypothetical protein
LEQTLHHQPQEKNMNYEDLTEEQFDCMAEQLVDTWHTLAKICEEAKGIGLTPQTHSICTAAIQGQREICSALEQDEDKEPQWPPVRKWKVGVNQECLVHFTTEVIVEASTMREAEDLALERANEDPWGQDWEEEETLEREVKDTFMCEELHV